MNIILCVDNSSSTRGCRNYWSKVSRVYEETKPYKLIYWNSKAAVKETFSEHSEGCTEPESFIELLETETSPYDPIVTTDGEIYEQAMETCSKRVNAQILELINSTVIYYIGNERSMNIGLNVIFGRSNKVSYHINEQTFKTLYNTFDDLGLEDLMSPNFAISLIVKIKNYETTYTNKKEREAKIAELRGVITKLYSRLEHLSLDDGLNDKMEEYYRNNKVKEFIDILSRDRIDVMEVSRQKTSILQMFDKKIDFNISRINAATTIQQQAIDVKPEEEVDNAWSAFEDVITLDKFNLPCLLVQNLTEPLIADSTIMKHPFKLLSHPEIIKKIISTVEQNPIDYLTYKKLSFDRKGYTVSPHTRAPCKGVFVLDATDMKCVKNNCRTMSVLFGDQNKVPGSTVLWNLVITYLVYKYKFYDTEYKEVIFDQIIDYCRKYKASLSFTHQCAVLRPARIEICLWYCIYAAPSFCPNTAKNVLRSPFGLELLEFYLDTFGQRYTNPESQIKFSEREITLPYFNGDINKYLKQLTVHTKKWAVWNYLLIRKNTPDHDLEIKAQYQNYRIYKDNIILMAGNCDVPYKSKCNLLDAESVNTLYKNLTNTSSKTDKIDFKTVPMHTDCNDLTDMWETSSHVKINIKTCWPTVICPVTKKHWRECIGDYDIKTGSHLRVFNTYCTKKKAYPESYMDLVLLYNKRHRDYVLKTRDFKSFELIFSQFQEVMNTYTCEDYIKTYRSYTDENLRLTME